MAALHKPTCMPNLKPRISRRVAWIAALSLLFILAAFLLLPVLVRPLMVDALQNKLQRPVAIGTLRFNPFTLAATVHGFTLGDKGSPHPASPQPLLQAKSLYVNLQARSLWERAPVIEEIRLEQPQLHLVRKADGSYNFDDLIAIFSKPSEGPPARFALNNIELVGGKIDFDDRAAGIRHTVSDVSLAIPFLSNLPYATEITVKPQLAATINGAPFKLAGQSRPFSAGHDTALQLSLQQVDLPAYLKYIPVPLGFTLKSGKLQTNLTITFQQAKDGAPQVKLSGTAELSDALATETDGKPLLAFSRLAVDLASADLASRRVQLRSAALEQPKLTVLREKNGNFNLARLGPATPSRPSAPANASNASNGRDTKDTASWQIAAAAVTVNGGLVDFKDLSLATPFQTRLKDIGLSVKDFDTQPNRAFSLAASMQTDGGESIKHNGHITLAPFKAEGDARLTHLDLKRYAPYYAAQAGMTAQQGKLDVSTRYRFEAGATPGLLLSGLAARLDALALRKQGGTADFLRITGLELQGGELDLAKRSLSVESLRSADGKVVLALSEDGQLQPALSDTVPRGRRSQAEQTLQSAPDTSAAPARPVVSARSEKKPSQPWQFQLKSLALDGYGVQLQTAARGRSSVLAADAIRLRTSNFSTVKGSSAELELQGRLGKDGSLRAEGKVAVSPLDLDLQLQAKGLPLMPFQPWFSDKLNVRLTGGTLSTRGRLRLAAKPDAGLRYDFNGDARVSRLASVDKQSGEEFLNWRALRLRQISATSEPALKLSIGEVSLADFYTRLVINRDGSLNYQDVLARPGQPGTTTTGAHAGAPQQSGQRDKPAPAPAQQAGAPASRAASISVAKVVLQGGHVDFRDNFIQPNYSAELTQLAGNIDGLSSDPGMLAQVALKGRVGNQGQLDITGKINPLSGNLFLDLLASLRDFELSPLSPYAAKYAGYGIERGKLSFDVRYKVENRQLSAQNKLVLNRLTFGDRVDSPNAPNLPVRLAVALLQDRNGNIDLDLPISGSLDDPQFSIGGIIMKAIVNLVGRAVTSPFSLIAGMFAEDDQSSHIAFASGSDELRPKAREKLKALAKAMQDRPALKLDISGRADAQFDSAGLKQLTLQRKMKVLKQRQLARAGESVASADDVQITSEDYPRLLARVYAQENIADKPRNMIGMEKSLAPEQMQALLLQHISVGEEDLRALANRRAQDVKDYLVQEGKVASERLFIVGAHPARTEERLPPARVDLVLGTR